MEFITKRLSLNEARPTWAQKISEDYGISADDAQFIMKGVVPDSKSYFAQGEKASVDYITTKLTDRDGEIVVPSGIILDEYRKTPVVLWAHNYRDDLPIGKNQWIKQDEHGLIAKTQYHTRENSFGKKVWDYLEDGFPLASSIGFVPFEWYDKRDFGKIDIKELGLDDNEIKKAVRIYTKSILLEYSRVPIPSNSGAVNIAISKGLVSELEKSDNKFWFFFEDINEKCLECEGENEAAKENEVESREGKEEKNGEAEAQKDQEQEGNIVTKPETTENYHHIPVSSGHDGHKIRTIVVSSSKGIKALYCIDCKKIKTYLFSTDKFTMEEAQQWVNSHKQKKEVEEVVEENLKTVCPSCGAECGDAMTCPECGEELEEDDKGCRKPKPRKKDVVYKERWNKALSSNFDIDRVEFNTTELYKVACDYFDCKVKHIFHREKTIGSAMIGNFLYAFREITKDYEIIDTRNINHYGYEFPPVYDEIQLDSKTKEEFLIEGFQFMKAKDGSSLIVSFSPSWYAMNFSIFSKIEDKKTSNSILKGVDDWIKENNFLRGEKFSLSGEFIKNSDETWEDIFLTEKNEKALRNAIKTINKNGKDSPNRGIILVGPPGTGKTMSGRVIMNDLEDSTFIWVSAKDFHYSGSVGGLAYAFGIARELAPSVLFIEDIDNWLSPRTIDLLKTEMDGLRKSTGVLTIMTSNHPGHLPKAIIDRPGRFHDILEIAYPDNESKAKMLKYWIGDIDDTIESIIINETSDMSGAHIYELVEYAKSIMIDEEDMDIVEALLQSLEKIKEQREFISDIRERYSVDKDIGENSINKDVSIATQDAIDKSGRVLSNRSRQTITDAIAALNELLSVSDSKKDDETEEIVEDKKPKEITTEIEINTNSNDDSFWTKLFGGNSNDHSDDAIKLEEDESTTKDNQEYIPDRKEIELLVSQYLVDVSKEYSEKAKQIPDADEIIAAALARIMGKVAE